MTNTSPDTLKTEVVEKFGLNADDIGVSTPLFSSGLLDSFNLVEIVLLLEMKAGRRLRVADVNLDNLDTIVAMHRLLQRMSEKKP